MLEPDQQPRHSLDHDLPARVEQVLSTFLADQRAQAERIDRSFTEAVDALTAFVLGGGKRIRPVFAWWGWRGAGGAAEGPLAEAVLHAVSALELVQACALVHDDLMDASERRRGAPTVHVAFTERHRSAGFLGDSRRFGLAASVLLGDLALVWADDMFAQAGLPPEMVHRSREPWQAMRTEVLAGQYLDVLVQAQGDESTEAALRVPRLKTAAYTVERPLHLGAALAGGSAELIGAFRRFGVDVGLAFQLRDDLLGVFGDPQVTGKPAGDDLREGKRTLLVALGLQLAEEKHRWDAAKTLRSALGDPELDDEGVGQVRNLLVELGAVAAVEQRIAQLTDSALATLRAASVAEPAATRLAELAIAAAHRRL